MLRPRMSVAKRRLSVAPRKAKCLERKSAACMEKQTYNKAAGKVVYIVSIS
ncbi:hypothetical protein LCM00_01950 [Bacillus infantis]|uniref:hypothetical protein n=1 Tax=Bacillus infantis TaxID=324767 RepID=UPI001CD71515|nr:hypothetical protein [Bacillus infantis]MCA1038259.1 hypothetical protein [Bacillus infantis]